MAHIYDRIREVDSFTCSLIGANLDITTLSRPCMIEDRTCRLSDPQQKFVFPNWLPGSRDSRYQSSRISSQAMSPSAVPSGTSHDQFESGLNLSLLGLGVEYPPFLVGPEALETLANRFYPPSTA